MELCRTVVRKSSIRVYTSGSQTGATWLTKGGIFNSWEEIYSREELVRKSCEWKNRKFLLFFNQHTKTAQRD